jgi:hypothetical protein
MIVLEIDLVSIIVFPGESYPPIRGDADRVARRFPLQPVKVKSGDVHVVRQQRRIKLRENAHDPVG